MRHDAGVHQRSRSKTILVAEERANQQSMRTIDGRRVEGEIARDLIESLEKNRFELPMAVLEILQQKREFVYDLSDWKSKNLIHETPGSRGFALLRLPGEFKWTHHDALRIRNQPFIMEYDSQIARRRVPHSIVRVR